MILLGLQTCEVRKSGEKRWGGGRENGPPIICYILL